MQSYSEIHRKKRFLLFDALTIARLNEQVLTAQVYDHFQFQTEPVKNLLSYLSRNPDHYCRSAEKFFAEQDAVIRLC